MHGGLRRLGPLLGLGPWLGPLLRLEPRLGPLLGLGPRLGLLKRLGLRMGLRLGRGLGSGPRLGPRGNLGHQLLCPPALRKQTWLDLRVGEGKQGRRGVPHRRLKPQQVRTEVRATSLEEQLHRMRELPRRTPSAAPCPTHGRQGCAMCSLPGFPRSSQVRTCRPS